MDKGVCNWYQDGRYLMQVLDDLPIPPRDEKGPLRVPVLDTMQDRGAVIFGKVESGTIKLGDQLKLMPSGILCQVHTIYNSKDQCVRYAKPGENVQLRLNIGDEKRVNRGDVICHRDQAIVPISELFEAEVDIMELISYKPILSKGYQCILHIHTVSDEVTVKEILVSYEKNEKGEVIEKQKPQYSRSFSKIICRIQTRIPIALEKHDQIAQLGRFTLRDEGRTIAVGKVLKYKPAKDSGVAPAQQKQGGASNEESKTLGATSSNTSTQAKEELVYDMETGETVTREEHNKRNREREKAQLEGIDEDDGSEDEAPA
jgi:peptide chain release factor subunit 3